MIFWIAPALNFLRAALPYALLFLRFFPENPAAPKPSPVGQPYTPPFTGGQCDNVSYFVDIAADEKNIVNGVTYPNTADTNFVATGRILGVETGLTSDNRPFIRLLTSNGAIIVSQSGATNPIYVNARIRSVTPRNGAIDNCGNLNNPIPNPPIPDDGLFNTTNPKIGDDNGTLNPAAIILAPGLPLALVGAIAAGYAAAMAAAKTATDILGGIQKLGEGFELLKELLKKLAEDLDEKEKLKPKNRDIVRQTYGQIKGDGAIDFFPNNNTKFEPIQIDIIIVFIPSGYGKYFGSFSPHRYRYKELGYISFYSVNQGILETHSIQFKRTTLQIPPLAIGFIYHLGLDEQIRGFAFGTFSVEKS